MYGVPLLGVRRLILSIAKMARVDVGLDDAQPNLRAAEKLTQKKNRGDKEVARREYKFQKEIEALKLEAEKNPKRLKKATVYFMRCENPLIDVSRCQRGAQRIPGIFSHINFPR